MFLFYICIYINRDEFPQRKYHKVNAHHHENNRDVGSVYRRCINRCIQYIDEKYGKQSKRKDAYHFGPIKDCPEKYKRPRYIWLSR